ncbi:hypothetical protein JYK00_01050 [Thermosipho ferrireducens]|uniref:Uncharacterized protein n=2 Tax=Thermosipho ferrireducens TaxID=2571116 RepID=A0ABX7S9B9_9BACT|nr:hypothetical protein JYK00_01050 [Thermosipho ferrireducens]
MVFFILYFVFWLFGYFSKKAAMKLPGSIPSREKGLKKFDEEAEIAAVFAAVYCMLGENIKIRSVKPVKENKNRIWEYWKKTGWRGVKKWSESSRYE